MAGSTAQQPVTNAQVVQLDAQVAAQQAARAAVQAARADLQVQVQVLRDQAQALRDAARSNTVQRVDFQRGPTSQQQKFIFVGFVIVVIAAVIILHPIARALGRRLEGARPRANLPDEGSREQLQRIEQSIDAISVEVERISEGQRFTTRLLSGRDEAMIPVGTRDAEHRGR